MTLETDAPEILARCRQDQVDAALLVADLTRLSPDRESGRPLPRSGTASRPWSWGAAKDIVEYAGVPRFLFSDFPLGNSCGKPHEPDTQAFTLDLALKVLESAVGPRTTVQSPLRWTDDGDWKLDYNNLARMPPEEVAKRRAEFDKVKQVALDQRKQAGVADPGTRAPGSLMHERAWRLAPSMSKPFTGVKILDFTRVLAGPYGSYQLALLGADVVKVESREGDDMRFGNRANDWEKRGLAAPWVAVNAGKRSITLDLKKPKAIEVVKRLVAKADVVMENFRPGVMDGLGIGYETLKAINPEADLLRRLGLRPGRAAARRRRRSTA